MSYTDVFGGSTVQAADVQFRAVALATSIVTVWPAFATTGNECARIMKVTPSAGSLTVTLPDATLTSAGMDVLFDNPSATTFTVLDSAGGVVATVAGGEVKYFYLSDSSTAAGTWRVTLFGVGASSVDAGQLAGYGLKALTSTLNFAPVVTQVSSNTVVSLSDRAKVFVWAGGSGTLTLPTTAGSTSDFSVEVHNQGTGTLTVATTGGVLVDGSATISLVVNESCFIHMGSADWYTVGRGRNTQFNFTQLNKVVTGGTVNLTLTEASNVVQTFTGALLSNQTVNQPAVVQVYYVSNATSGAYTLTFGCVAGGTAVAVAQSQAAILFCDGTNIINANTSLAGGIATIIFGAGSAAAPSIALNTADTGFYSSGSDEIGVSNNGVYAGKFTTGGFKTELAGAAAVQAISSGSTAGLIADRPAGSVGSVRLRTSGTDRWSIEETATAESGANAGSNLALNAYSDAGALLGTALTAVRSTQVATFTQPPVLVGTNITGVPISTGVSDLGTGVATFLATPSSANLAAALTDETGTGANVFANSPTLVTPALGTPSALVGTNITGTAAGLTAGNVTTNANLTGHVTSVGNSAVLGSFTSAQLATALTDETGSGANVFATSPTLVTPILGVATGTSFQGIIGNVTPAAGTFTALTSTGNAALGDAEASDTHAIKGATTLLSNSASPALKVTNTGAGVSLLVEDSASVDATPTMILASGEVLVGTTDTGFAAVGRIVSVAGNIATTQAFLSSVVNTEANATRGFRQNIDGVEHMALYHDNTKAVLRLIGTDRMTVASDGATTLLANSASAALTVTQTGAGNAFVVEDSASTDSTPFVIDASGKVLIGGTTSVAGTFGTQATLQNLNFGTTAIARFFNDASAPAIDFIKSRSGTVGGHTVVQSGDSVADFYFSGSDGTQFIRAAQITAAVDGTPGTNDMPGRLIFSTTADGASSPTEAMRIDNTRKVHIGSNNGLGAGALNVLTASGTATAVYLYQASVTNWDITIPASTNALTFNNAGTERMRIDSAGNVGIGASSTLDTKVRIGGTVVYPASGGSSFGLKVNGISGSGGTSNAGGVISIASTEDAAATYSSVYSYYAQQGTVSGGSRIATTNYYGFIVDSTPVNATNNYGFYSNIAAAANRFNFHAAGTADNYFAGKITSGATIAAISYIHGAATVATPAGGSIAFAAGVSALGVYFGSGVPTVSAAQGSLYMRSDGSSTSTRMYVNTNGTTGWTAVTTAT